MGFTSKTDARKHYRDLRDSLSENERASADAAIAAQVCALPEFADAHEVFTYLSVGAEVDTRQLIRAAWDAGKLVAIPRCVPGTNTMDWHRIQGFDDLESGSFGIEEPPDDPATLVDVPKAGQGVRAVALVPGYSFDQDGYRLGYGGGFYDVFLPSFGGAAVGLCRTAQLSAGPVPHDAHDIPVDVVACETHVIRRPAHVG